MSFLDLFENLAHAAFLALFDLLNFAHDILEEVLYEHLSLLVAIQALVDFYANHLTQLVRYLSLVVLETIDLVANRVIDLGDLAAKSNFLLRSGHLFLSDPAVDAADLRLQVCRERCDRLVFPLELLANVGVHLVITLAHLLNTLSALLLFHPVLHLDLVANIIDLPCALFLLSK